MLLFSIGEDLVLSLSTLINLYPASSALSSTFIYVHPHRVQWFWTAIQNFVCIYQHNER